MSYPKVINPKMLRAAEIEGEVVQVGSIFNYKPSVARFSDGSLVLFTIHWHIEPDLCGVARAFHSTMYRSYDEGKSWSVGRQMPFVGHEPSACVIDDVLFVQTHVFHSDPLYVSLMVYRSEDRGETWTSFELTADLLPDQTNKFVSVGPARNFIKLTTGEIVWYVNSANADYRVSSTDLGKHWKFEKMVPTDPAIAHFNHDCSHTVTCEAVTFYSPSGRLLQMGRIEWQRLQGFDIPYKFGQQGYHGTDAGDGLVLMESLDNGYTWKILRGVGISGMMYPSVYNLDDHRFVLQYTMRTVPSDSSGYLYPHMGVHAIVATENDDGTFTMDFDHDLIIIDDRVPDYSTQGGGYGMIIPLTDGTLLSPYSIRELTPQFAQAVLEKRWNDKAYMEYFWHRLGDSHSTWEWFSNLDDIVKQDIFIDMGLETRETMFISQVLRWKLP